MEETIELIKKLETSKSSKKLLAAYKKNLKIENVGEVTEFLYSLPIMMQSRWEILNVLKLETYEDFVFDEMLACSADQDCATRCSSLVIGLAQSSSENLSSKVAETIFQAMSSPSSATRSNVVRSWISRMISNKSTESIISRVLLLAEAEILRPELFSDDIEYRELIGVTCVDLEWKSKFELDPVSQKTLAFYAYFNVLLSTLGSGSQIKIQVDEKILELGIDYIDSHVRFLSYTVARDFSVFPDNLEDSVMENLKSEDVLELAYTLKEAFSEVGKNLISLEKKKLEEEKKSSSRFYPSEKKSHIEVILGDYPTTIASTEDLFKLQSDSEYPSVAEVMENLKKRSIDERFYVEKMTKLLDYCASQNWKNQEVAEAILRIISRCPLRAVVDYGGEIVRKKCKETKEFRDYSYQYAIELLKKEDENSRALFFEVTLIATILEDEEKMADSWEVIKTSSSIKKRKMFEMLANVVENTATSIAWNQKREMLLYSIGILDTPCTQLFEAVVSKILLTRHETDRCYLFTQNEEIYELIEEISNGLINLENKKSIHLGLYFFSRFVIGSLKFYTAPKILIIQQMSKFIVYCLKKFENDKIMYSAALEAASVIANWSSMRDEAYNAENSRYMYCHHWELLRNVVKKRNFVNESSLLTLPGLQNISARFDDESWNLSEISLRTFSDKHTVAFLVAKTAKKTLSDKRKLDLLKLSSRVLEEVNDDEFIEEYRMVFSWISRACCYLGVIDPPKRFGILKKKIAQNLLQC